MIVLGIDPGYERCGYAILKAVSKKEHGTRGKGQGSIPHTPYPSILDLGVIKTSPKEAFSDRLKEVGDDIALLLKTHQPDILSIEDLFFVQNVTNGLRVAEVRGMITYLAKQQSCLILEPKPIEVKHSFTGNGKADKKAMLEMAHHQFDLPTGRLIDDAIDALAIAYFGLLNAPKL